MVNLRNECILIYPVKEIKCLFYIRFEERVGLNLVLEIVDDAPAPQGKHIIFCLFV